jgi:hypothetical protein
MCEGGKVLFLRVSFGVPMVVTSYPKISYLDSSCLMGNYFCMWKYHVLVCDYKSSTTNHFIFMHKRLNVKYSCCPFYIFKVGHFRHALHSALLWILGIVKTKNYLYFWTCTPMFLLYMSAIVVCNRDNIHVTSNHYL